ncbi:hypothetical protein LG284_00620 [Citricoccus nitrophenolicus]
MTYVTFVNGDANYRNSAYHHGLVPVAPPPPNTSEINALADRVETVMTDAFWDVAPVATQWTGLDGFYITDDTDTVLSAMEPHFQRLTGIRDAGLEAAGHLRAFAQGMEDYETSRGAYHDKVHTMVLAYLAEDKDEYAVSDLINPLITEGTHLNGVHFSLYKTLNDSLGKIEVDVTGNIGFTKFSAGHNSVDSQAELESFILQSAGFEGISAEDARRLVAHIDLESLPYTMVDDEGRRWVLTEDGTMVMSGSPMDPYLNELLLRAVAEDPELHDVEINFGEDHDGVKQVVSGAQLHTTVASMGLGAATTLGVAKGGPGTPSLSSAVSDKLGTAGKVKNVFDVAANAAISTHDIAMGYRAQAPLMSQDHVAEIEDAYISRETLKESITTVAGVPTGAVADATFIQSRGLSYVVVYFIDEGVARLVTYVVDSAWDMRWTEDEMMEHSQEIDYTDAYHQYEYEELLESTYIHSEPVPLEPEEVVTVDEHGEIQVVTVEPEEAPTVDARGASG